MLGLAIRNLCHWFLEHYFTMKTKRRSSNLFDSLMWLNLPFLKWRVYVFHVKNKKNNLVALFSESNTFVQVIKIIYIWIFDDCSNIFWRTTFLAFNISACKTASAIRISVNEISFITVSLSSRMNKIRSDASKDGGSLEGCTCIHIDTWRCRGHSDFRLWNFLHNWMCK